MDGVTLESVKSKICVIETQKGPLCVGTRCLTTTDQVAILDSLGMKMGRQETMDAKHLFKYCSQHVFHVPALTVACMDKKFRNTDLQSRQTCKLNKWHCLCM